MKGDPPDYHEAIQMDGLCPASAPLLTSGLSSSIPSLDESFYPLPETINLSLSPDSEDPSTFHVRDTRDCVLVIGVIDSGQIILKNANGTNFLNIQRCPNSGDEEEEDDENGVPAERIVGGAQNFKVFHDRFLLGTIQVNESDLNWISTSNLVDKYDFFINVFGDSHKDVVISKSRNVPPLCRSSIPYSSSATGPASFTATINFGAESFATKIEQCLCISTVISFILIRNTAQQRSEGKNSVKVIGIFILILTIFGLLGWGFIAWLNDMECKKKPYRCKN